MRETRDNNYACNLPIIRRDFRGDTFVYNFRFKWVNGDKPGCLVRWVDPGNWMGIDIACGDGKARLIQRKHAEDSAGRQVALRRVGPALPIRRHSRAALGHGTRLFRLNPARVGRRTPQLSRLLGDGRAEGQAVDESVPFDQHRV